MSFIAEHLHKAKCICLSFLSVCLSVFLSLYVCPSVCLFSLYVCPSVCLFSLYVCLSVYLCMSVRLSVSVSDSCRLTNKDRRIIGLFIICACAYVAQGVEKKKNWGEEGRKAWPFCRKIVLRTLGFCWWPKKYIFWFNVKYDLFVYFISDTFLNQSNICWYC